MKKVVMAFAVALLAVGCAQYEYAATPDGRGSYAIDCPSRELHICFTKARELCPRGYDVLSTRRPDNPLLPTVWQDRVVVRCHA